MILMGTSLQKKRMRIETFSLGLMLEKSETENLTK